ncbi:hypothetical protein BC830DRAFT_413058 [Chytriomyces sp. MP71]|nr:hypothetical protein BC830DRAFT_413058 [Chytriomyces sp. MP71]
MRHTFLFYSSSPLSFFLNPLSPGCSTTPVQSWCQKSSQNPTRMPVPGYQPPKMAGGQFEPAGSIAKMPRFVVMPRDSGVTGSSLAPVAASSSSGLGVGALFGICLGAVIVIAGCVIAGVYVHWKRLQMYEKAMEELYGFEAPEYPDPNLPLDESEVALSESAPNSRFDAFRSDNTVQAEGATTVGADAGTIRSGPWTQQLETETEWAVADGTRLRGVGNTGTLRTTETVGDLDTEARVLLQERNDAIAQLDSENARLETLLQVEEEVLQRQLRAETDEIHRAVLAGVVAQEDTEPSLLESNASVRINELDLEEAGKSDEALNRVWKKSKLNEAKNSRATNLTTRSSSTSRSLMARLFTRTDEVRLHGATRPPRSRLQPDTTSLPPTEADAVSVYAHEEDIPPHQTPPERFWATRGPDPPHHSQYPRRPINAPSPRMQPPRGSPSYARPYPHAPPDAYEDPYYSSGYESGPSYAQPIGGQGRRPTQSEVNAYWKGFFASNPEAARRQYDAMLAEKMGGAGRSPGGGRVGYREGYYSDSTGERGYPGPRRPEGY